MAKKIFRITRKPYRHKDIAYIVAESDETIFESGEEDLGDERCFGHVQLHSVEGFKYNIEEVTDSNLLRRIKEQHPEETKEVD